ncbi:MAG: M14 family metallopeptidase [Allomuricauda sp.]
MKRVLYLFFLLNLSLTFAQDDIYWWNELPENWNGNWPEELQTACEKSDFTYTAKWEDILEYFSTLMWKSENVHFFNMFISDMNRPAPTLVMSNPRITSPEEAKASGKPVIYLQGGIHPDEGEGKEALLMVIRDILFGNKKYLLDDLIIIVQPNFNVDGNEARRLHNANPRLYGIRQNAMGFDVNRDAIKLETTNMQGAYETLLNQWDPILILDTHRMGRTRYAYGIAQATSNVVTAHQAPREFVTYKMFPAIVEEARKTFKIEIGMHCGLNEGWPPTEFTHDNAIWSTEGKFMASGYGLRNRMSILVETPGGQEFEKAIYVSYAYIHALLEVCKKNGKQMMEICQKAEEEVVENIKKNAASGNLKNFTSGKYVSDGKISVPAYRDRKMKDVPGTSLRVLDRTNPPEWVDNVDLITKPVGVKEATVPRGYLIPEGMENIIEKLRMHGVKVTQLEKPVTASGEQFVSQEMTTQDMGWRPYKMTTFKGDFAEAKNQTFPAGTYHVDMAQPLANLIFYALEPQVKDGFLGWKLMDDYLIENGAKKGTYVYPIFKYFTMK